MNKLNWKMYLNSIINAKDSFPQKYPSINSNLATYCFKYHSSFKDKLIICPNIGLVNPMFNKFFTSYRITSLNIYFNGTVDQFQYEIKPNDIYNPTSNITHGDLKLIYYPHKPQLKKQEFDVNSITYYILAPTIDVYINYEIIPLMPNVTIPSYSEYSDISGFEEEYMLIPKNQFKGSIIKNDIPLEILDIFNQNYIND